MNTASSTWGFVTAITATLAACTGGDPGGDPASDISTNIDLTEAALIAEEMGFDLIVLPSAADYFDRVGECMSRRGFDFIAPPAQFGDTQSDPDEATTVRGVTYTEEDFTALFGFGIADNLIDEVSGPMSTTSTRSFDPNEEYFNGLSEVGKRQYVEALHNRKTGCHAVVTASYVQREKVPYEILLAEAYDDDRVVEFIHRWVSCMRAAGYSYNDPAEPTEEFEMRASEIVNGIAGRVFNGATNPEQGAELQVNALRNLQTEEILVAVASLECGGSQFAGQELLDEVMAELEADR